MSPAPEHPAASGAAGPASIGDAGAALGGADPGVLGVIAELQGKLTALGRAHEEKLKRDEAALAERVSQTEAIEQRLAADRAQIEGERRTLDEMRQRLEAHAAELQQKRAAAEAHESQAAELAAAVERANKELAQREGALKASEAQAKERERRSQEAAALAASAAAEAAKEAAARAADAVAAIQRAEAAEAELERASTERGDTDRKQSDEARALRTQLEATSARAEQAQALAQASDAEATALRERLAAATAAAESARSDQQGASELLERAAELEAKVAELGEQVAKRDRAIELMQAKLTEAGERATSSASGENALPSVEARRRRLSRYRQLVQNEARKIVAAKEILARRQSECESVLAQRAKLVQHAQALAAREAKLGSRRSVVEATGAVCFAVGAVLLVAVLSWGAVSQAFPATYIATAVVSAEAKGSGREPDLVSWQSYHEQLVNDPRLMEETAERMARRGIASLSKASAVTARLKADLMLTSDAPGMLRLELRGQGAERTTRELETFATALVAMANTARESRADGAASVQSRTATPGEEPVEDQRLVYAAAFTAGGTGLAAVIGLIAWMQLSRAKRRYEAAGISEE